MVRLDTILYAEDDDNYAELLACTLKQAGFEHSVHHVSDGGEAMAYLKGEGKYSDRTKFPIPGVVLADLKMPRVNGFELLDWIRRQSPFPHLPVIVLTLSEELKDVKRAYSLGANSFLIKPPNVEDLKDLLKMLDGYWLKYNVMEDTPDSAHSQKPRQK